MLSESVMLPESVMLLVIEILFELCLLDPDELVQAVIPDWEQHLIRRKGQVLIELLFRDEISVLGFDGLDSHVGNVPSDLVFSAKG